VSVGIQRQPGAAPTKQSGFSLIEVSIAVAIVGIMAAIGIPSFTGWLDAQRVRNSVRDAADAMALARTEAIRTGTNHIVWFGIGAITGTDLAGNPVDPTGNPIVDQSGNPVSILVHDDTSEDCRIDAGEPRQGFVNERNVQWGTGVAAFKPPADGTAAAMAAGSSLASPTNPAASVAWVLFRGGDGVPVTFSGDPVLGCGTIGSIGTGTGAIYMSDGVRDYAALLSPVGGVRVFAWDEARASWR